jgi:sugar-specific transcriptional regulator TrmB
MLQEEEPIQAFTNLGLTYLQAKVYVTLLKLGSSGANVKKIALNAAIARQDIYRILPVLENYGLVEKIIAAPTRYRPVTLEDGLSLLMDLRSREFQDMQIKAKMVLKNFVAQEPEYLENVPQFRITSARSLFIKRIKEGIAQAENSIDLIYDDSLLRAIVFDTIDDFERAISRGVKIRAITMAEGEQAMDRNLEALTKKPYFMLHFAKEEVTVGLAIFDDKEVEFRTTQNIVPTLWTNNRNIVKLAQVYFNSMWQ